MLTKESFTRDEWDHLFRLLNIMNFWMVSCSYFFQRKSRVSCPMELSEVLLKKGRKWRNRDQRILCQGTSWVRRKFLRKIRVIRTAQGIKNWIRVVFHPAAGN